MSDFAIGCSHTYGVGVDPHESWPALLQLKNYGVSGISTDCIARVIPGIIDKETPSRIFILWPDWTRFEYVEAGQYRQSLPSDSNRIKFMAEWTDSKLQENFQCHVNAIETLCKQYNIKLIALSLDDLIPHIDHADKWPLSKLGHHYSPVWHQWVAEIFKQKENE